MAEKKLCKWDKERIKKRREELAVLVDPPRYLCKKCARVAAHKAYLCKPVARGRTEA
jgi:hypothetical protein